jgi:hypothetical protein
MIDKRRLVFWLRPFALFWLGVGLSGCSRILGPERMPVTRVWGKVTQAGHPVGGGWIEFLPTDGTVGDLRSARLKHDGTFDADRVAVGLNVIRLVNTSIEARGAAKLFGEYTSPIRRTIPERPDGALTIDIVDEAARWQESRMRRASSESRRTGERR